jgi:hypothetical protein
MTQSPEDLEQQQEWQRGARKLLLLVALLLVVSPLLCAKFTISWSGLLWEDPLSLVRAAVNKISIGILSSVMLAKAYVWFDQVWPGSMSKIIGGNPVATAILGSTFIACIAFLVAWA